MINYSTIKLFLTKTSNFSSRDRVIKIICRNQNGGTKGGLNRCQTILWYLLTCHFTRTSQRHTRPNLRSFPVRLDPTLHGTALLSSLMNGHGQASNITCDAPNAGKQALLFRLISIGFITCEDLDI